MSVCREIRMLPLNSIFTDDRFQLLDLTWSSHPDSYWSSIPAGSHPFTARSPGRISPVHVAWLLICLKYTKWDHTEVRVCLDPSNLNKAIIREHHKPMTVEEITHELARATVYMKADALKAFLQIHLMHEASLLTTFNSHRE